MYTIKFSCGYWAGWDDITGDPTITDLASAAKRTFYARAARIAEAFAKRGIIGAVVRL